MIANAARLAVFEMSDMLACSQLCARPAASIQHPQEDVNFEHNIEYNYRWLEQELIHAGSQHIDRHCGLINTLPMQLQPAAEYVFGAKAVSF